MNRQVLPKSASVRRALLAASLLATTVAVAPQAIAGAQTADLSDGTFVIRDQNFGRYLSATDGNVNTAFNQAEWNLIATPDGYVLQNVATGLYLNANGQSDIDPDNYNVDLSTDSGNVLWELIDAGDGAVRISSIEVDRFVDADRRNLFNVDTSRQERPDTAWEFIPVDANNDGDAPDAPNAPDAPANPGDPIGAVFVGTNDLDNNAIASFARAADGTLSPVGEFSTGGRGSTDFDGGEGLDPLISADSIIVTEDEQFLLTVNAGSNEIVSFRINDDFSLTRISVIDSGGVGPNSVAVDNGLVYVTNIDRDGFALGDPNTPRAEPNDEGNVVGFNLSADGVLTPNGFSADLDNRPANIDFSTDGDRLIVSSITSGSAALPGENSQASVYSFDVLRSGRLQLADTNTPTLRGNAEGRNLPSAIDFDITVQNGREFVVVTEAREFNAEGGPPALPALQAGSVTVYELGADSSLNITEGDFAFTDGDPAAPNAFGADGQQLTACWIDFGHGSGSDIFYVSNAINATISSVRLADDGSLEIIEATAAAGTSGFAENGVAQDGPTTFGQTDGFIDLDVSPDGDYLYQLEGLSGSIGVYELDGVGGLVQIQELTGELPEIDTQGLVAIGG